MLFLQFLLLLGGSCAIDGYDEAPSCSSFAPGSFDIDVIFHVHCTKPVWCMTASTGKASGRNKATVPWSSITESPGVYISCRYFPAEIPFKEPTRLTYAQVTATLQFWHCQQQATPHDIFRFKKWKDIDGTMCNLVTNKPASNQNTESMPVQHQSTKSLGKRPEKAISGRIILG